MNKARVVKLDTARTREPEIVTDDWALIPEGAYRAVIRDWKRQRPFKADKLYLALDVLVPGPTSGREKSVRLHRHYNVTVLPHGRLHVSPGSDYYREWVIVTGRRPARGDRLGPSALVGAMVEVRVGTVTHGFSRDGQPRRPIHEAARYSVVREICAVIAGGGPRP